MNVSCSADMCPVILDSTCVFYSGGNLFYTGINTNDNLQTVIIKINNKFKDAGLGYVFNNGLTQAIPGDPVQLGGTLIQNTTIDNNGFTFTFIGTVEASSFITTGGTSSQFVKGDGSLDSTSYQPSGNYITALTGDGTANGPGSAVFTLSNSGVIANTYGSNSQVPVITVDAKGRVTNITNTAISYPSQSILISGDVVGAGLTGANVTLTLNTVNSGVYPAITPLKFSVNGKGLVTGASPLTNLDLNTIYGYTPVPNSRTLTINGQTYDLSANRTWNITTGGTVSSVSVTNGIGISASVANPTTTPNITITNTAPDQTVVLNDGAGISVTGTYPNFTITNISPSSISGSGTTNYVSKWSSSTSLTDSIIYDNGSNVGIGTIIPGGKLTIQTGNNAYPLEIRTSSFGGANRGGFEFDGSGNLELPLQNSTGSENVRLRSSGDTFFNGGNVGVGTTTPGYKLDVTGTFHTTGQNTLGNLAGTGTRMVVASSTGVLSTQTIPSGGGGTVTSIATTSPITGGTITTTGTIGITQAGVSSDGYLSSTDWNTFNNKLGSVPTLQQVVTAGDTTVDKTITVTATGSSTFVRLYDNQVAVWDTGAANTISFLESSAFTISNIGVGSYFNIDTNTVNPTMNVNSQSFTFPTTASGKFAISVNGITPNAAGNITVPVGGTSRSVNVVSTNTSAGSTSGTDYVYLVSGTTTITLPTAVGNTNLYTIKRVGTNTVSIATTSSQTIDGSASPITINVQNVSLDFISDGTNWNII